jgi:hypothetical protein
MIAPGMVAADQTWSGTMILNENELDDVCGGNSIFNSHMNNLQSLMGSHSKFVEALNNIMHTIDAAQGTIIQNLKG